MRPSRSSPPVRMNGFGGARPSVQYTVSPLSDDVVQMGFGPR